MIGLITLKYASKFLFFLADSSSMNMNKRFNNKNNGSGLNGYDKLWNKAVTIRLASLRLGALKNKSVKLKKRKVNKIEIGL
jgi:hypothetical protein